jgi:hypothetical protein
MNINDLEFPSLFIETISTGRLKREIGSWELIRKVDAFGNLLETSIGEMFDTVERIRKETENLAIDFEVDGYYGEPAPDLEGPGAIPDILDFSEIICFAISGDGSPFCFDYRNSPDKPSVIWWDDVYWRKIAPDFDSFIALFNLNRGS